MIEATNEHFTLPEKGIVGRHAIFDPAMLDTPQIDEAFKAQQDERTWRVSVKRRNALSTVTYPVQPARRVGWHGDLSVVRINWRDLRPLMSHRAHLPPSAHTTFVAGRFVVCTFVPRPFESDPEALKLPFFHNNDDFDEVHLLSRGQLLQPRQHPSRHDDGASLAASRTARTPRRSTPATKRRQDRDRRGRGHDRRARRARHRAPCRPASSARAT